VRGSPDAEKWRTLKYSGFVKEWFIPENVFSKEEKVSHWLRLCPFPPPSMKGMNTVTICGSFMIEDYIIWLMDKAKPSIVVKDPEGYKHDDDENKQF